MHSEAQYIVVMTEVKALRVLLSVIHHHHSRHMIHHLSGLSVEQIIPAVTAPVPETQTHTHKSTTTAQINQTTSSALYKNTILKALMEKHLIPKKWLSSEIYKVYRKN